jgi:hypothetical protein
MNSVPTWLRIGALGILLATAAAVPPAPAANPPPAKPPAAVPAQATYATADEAASALADAAKANDTQRLRAVLGPGSEQLIASGDAVDDADARERFAAAFAGQHKLVANGPDRMTVLVGPRDWPLPMPLVQAAGRWRFDAAAGAQELIDRRIGRNEIAAISACLAYVDAQKAYFALTGKQGAARYAARVISQKGRQDGLYWPAAAGEPASPLGEFVAAAEDEGYPLDIIATGPRPLRGYLYRVLTAQGPSAPGGARSYLSGGQLTGGFALLAWPVRYGVSGIMTFIVDQDGLVFQRDLGPGTAKAAAGIKAYDPDIHWTRVDVTP